MNTGFDEQLVGLKMGLNVGDSNDNSSTIEDIDELLPPLICGVRSSLLNVDKHVGVV